MSLATRPTRARSKRGDTRTKMLISAAEVMRERGAAGVTIDEVLTRSGAPRGSVYYHFPHGRNQILTEALRYAGDAITADIDDAAGLGAKVLLRQFVEFWERVLADSDFNAGCPVVAAAIGSADDDVLLDTGVSFPIAFAKARIIGEEVRLEVPRWGRFSGSFSYANQSGLGQGPITGGLLLGSAAESGLTDTSKFAVSQDQRNTARVRIRFQAPHRMWLAFGAQYGSGLPADTGDADPTFLLTQYGEAILERVNLGRSRVRPNCSLDAASGVEFYRKEQRSGSFQIQAANLNNRVNVINFASLFSGTAVAPPRSVSARLRLTF